MIRRDYILRMVAEMAQVLARVISLKSRQEYEQALKEINAALRELRDDSAEPPEELSLADWIALCRKHEQAASGLMVAVANLLKEQADVLAVQGKPDGSARSRAMALGLFLEALLNGETFVTAELLAKVEDLFAGMRPTLSDPEVWRRLVGYFEARGRFGQAEDALFAWLAIGDEVTSSAGPAETLPAVERIGSDPALDPAALASLVADARAAMTARDYTKAIAALTKLQRQPEFPQRAAMQELLGLARERSGQLAHAKAEYEEYLRRYPTGEAAERITRRLATLRAASLAARTGTGGGGAAATGWTVNGGFSQTYRNDSTSVSNTVNGPTGAVPNNSPTQQQNAVYTDVDLLARDRGERFDLLARVSAGYAKNFAGSSATSSNDSTKRVSVATIEIDDRKWGLLGRFGRQSRNSDGVLGTFDGAFASWQIVPSWAINVTAGYPVEQTNLGIQRERSFWSVAIPYTPPGAH